MKAVGTLRSRTATKSNKYMKANDTRSTERTMTRTDKHPDAQRTAVRPTRQRRAVAAALAGFDDFRSAQEIHDLITRQGDSVGLATVYRTLAALADAGEVDMLRNEDGQAIWRSCSDTHHHHLVSRSCGATVKI